MLCICICRVTLADDSQRVRESKVEFFENSVRPLLVARCLECHSSEEHAGGLSLDWAGGLASGGDSGPAIVAGDVQASLLMKAVEYDDPNLQMPPEGKLSGREISLLRRWIADGAIDPRSDQTQGKTTQGMSIEAGKQFWSLKPIGNPSIPAVNSDDIETAIDCFIRDQLDVAGMQWAPRANANELLRRVTLDLTGLPPTPGEVASFLADESPDSYERVVERLLASPQYGERWGRHWLDVARYADSNGLDENLAFGNAWRYRDWVVRATNEDLPIDDFIMSQLAGDLLPNANRDSVTATGFLALGAKVLAEPDREKLAMDTVDEQIDTLGKAFLGMTLGCARCHDHKFDPVKQDDYYALAAIFRGTESFGATNTGAIKHWYEQSYATEDERKRLAEVDQRIAEAKSAATKFKNATMQRLRIEAQQNAAKYLAAAARFSADSSLADIEVVARAYGLHPRILHHTRRHLAFNREQPFFKDWHDRRRDFEQPEALFTYYQELFAAAAEAEAESTATKSTPSHDFEKPPRPRVSYANWNREFLSQANAAMKDSDGFLTVPPQPEYAFSADDYRRYDQLMNEARLLESVAPDETAVMAVRDGQVLTSIRTHIRGSHRNLGQPVEREFPEVMRRTDVRPIWSRQQSGRLELANWIASSQHPLTARVYVNRVWARHFGRGLVATTENFGVNGERPSHPELLDWLARSFIASGWSTKWLHRQIVLSRTYRSSSSSVRQEADPENRLLSHFSTRRMDVEQIRDSILAVSGSLDESVGGKTVPLRNKQFVFNHTSVDHTRYESCRRAVYLPVIRNNLYPMFQQFDYPDPTMPTGVRQTTVVAPQALLLMNDPFLVMATEQFAQKVCEAYSLDDSRLDYAYMLTLARVPSDEERQRARALLEQLTAANDEFSESQLAAWRVLCHALVTSNEFLFIP